MEPQKIFVEPRSNKARISKSNKERRYRCPLCQKSWVNRNEAVLHIKTCSQKRQDERRQNQLIYGGEMEQQQVPRQKFQVSGAIEKNREFQIFRSEELSRALRKNEENQKQMIKLKQQLHLMEAQITQIKQKIPILGSIIQLEQLQYITNQIVQSDFVSNLLKSTIQPQIQQLLQSGFESNQILIKGKNILIEKISQVRIVESFSKHSRHMQKLEKLLQQQYKDKDKAYKNQVMLAFNFIKKFSERQLKFQSRIIQQVSQLSFYKRKNICILYERLRTVYHDIFKFDMLPLRLTKTQGGNKLRRRKININILFSEVKRLLASNQYELACDIWMGVSLGLRSSQYKQIEIQRGTGQIAKLIRLTQKKNKNMITRVIPRSLANIVKRHDIKYPISEQRFSEVRSFCLKQFGTFYGLRSTAISLILSKLAYESEIGRFHNSVSTTRKYYLNTDIEEVVHGIFALQDYDQDIQTNLQVFFQDGQLYFQEIMENNNYSLDFENKNQYLEDSLKDSIILGDSQEKQLTLVNKIRRVELQHNIEASLEEFSSLNEALNVQSTENIDDFCKNQNVFLSILEVNAEEMIISTVEEVGEMGGSQARVIKTISSESLENEVKMVFKVDQGKMGRQQLLDKMDSYKKSTLPQLRSFSKCSICRSKYIITQSQNHFKVSCPIDGDCENQEAQVQGFPTERQFKNTASLEHQLKLKKIELGRKNNMKEMISLRKKQHTKRILYSKNVPDFKINIPLGNEELYDAIKHVEENQQFLPIQIRHTKLGYGVFATANIPKNTLICTYTGVVEEARFVNKSDDSLVEFGMFKIQQKVYGLLLTCTQYCNVGRFFNSSKSYDSKSKNLILQKTIDGENRIVNIMFSSRLIEQGEQIKWFYGQQYWKSSNITPMSEQESEEMYEKNQRQQKQQDLDEVISKNPCEEIIVEDLEPLQQITKLVQDKFVKAILIRYNNRIISLNPNRVVQIASIIKLLNAKVCLKEIGIKKITWQTQFQMPCYFADQASRAYLRRNKSYCVKDLMRAALVPSGCDAAYCLAYNIGILYSPDNPEVAFVEKMNLEAAQLGMVSTNILEPTGFGNSVSTAQDLMKLVRWMRSAKDMHPFLRQKSMNLQRELPNTNQLLRQKILGKTGLNQSDGHSFIGYSQQEDFQVVLLGAHQKFVTFSKIPAYLKMIKAVKFP